MDDKPSPVAADNRATSPLWRIFLPLGVGFLILTGLIGYGYHLGERMYAVESPMLNSVREIELESAALRYRIEEALDGEAGLTGEPALSYLDQAIAYLRSLHNTLQKPMLDIHAGRLPELAPMIERLTAARDALKELAVRLHGRPETGPADELRAGMAKAFSDFSGVLNEIQAVVEAHLETKRASFRLAQAILIGACILLGLGAALAVRRYERDRSGNISRLIEANRLLAKEVAQRQTAERLFRTVFNGSPVSIVIARLEDMRVVDVNDWFLSVTGFSREEIIARSFEAVVACDDPLSGDGFQQRISTHKQLRNLECRLPVKTGQIRTALLSAILVDLDGETHILSAARDITEYKAAEETLRQSEERFRSLFESAPDFIQLLDPQGLILLANPEACRRLGFSSGELVGRPFEDFLSSESRQRFREHFSELLAKGGQRAEYDIVQRTGEIIPLDCSATKVESEGGSAYIVLFQKDITERRRNELKFKTVHRFLIAANRHQELQTMLADFLAVIEEATGCEAAAVRVEDETLAQPFVAARGFELDSCRPSLSRDARLCAHILQNQIDAEESGYTPNGSFYCNSASSCTEAAAGDFVCPVHPICGQPPHESFALIPVQGPREAIGLIHIAYRAKNKIIPETIEMLEAAALQLGTAIQRVRAEEALKCSHDELEERVRERTEQLTAANERLVAEVLERALTERSLLQHQQLLRKLSSVLAQTEERERHRIATAIHDGVGQTLAAAKIKLGSARSSIPPDVWEGQLGEVRGLITLAIEETRSLTFELSPPVLYEIGLRAALGWMAERFQRKFGLEFTVEDDGCDRQMSIPRRVFAFQSVRELCFNVVKHAKASRVRVSLFQDGDFIRIEVADDGAGFDVQQRPQPGGEMGFGLFSIREQLRHYGGTLTLDSRPGGGSRVTLRLPPADAAENEGEADRHDQRAAGG
jgi:PAS domain S-box-containing protein